MTRKKELEESLLPANGGAGAGGCIAWQLIFYANVFMACIAFSIVMPSLFLYLSDMGASASFYALVVAIFSVGEAIGSLALGSLSNAIGTKRTMQCCAMLSLCGSLSYALADTLYLCGWRTAGPWTVFLGRLLQGIGSGGQQAVEQSYLAIAAPPEQRTELTSKLSTFASLGFIFGPALGAGVSQTPSFDLGPVRFTTFTKQGWVVAALNVIMLLNTFAFTEVRRRGSVVLSADDAAETAAASASGVEEGASGVGATAAPDGGADASSADGGGEGGGSTAGVWACIMIFFVHFNGFAVQETITTPLVEHRFGWDDVAANLLFTAAGLANLLCAIVMAWLSGTRVAADGTRSQLVGDRTLLSVSLVLALVGWLLMVPSEDFGVPTTASTDLTQFGAAFTLVTVAFPFGRGICLAMVGKLLGDQPQGAWMGIMFALGAIARIVGPFWAVSGYWLFGALAVFGSTALLFALSLLATRYLWYSLTPAPDASGSAVPPPPLVQRPASGGTPFGGTPHSFSKGASSIMASPLERLTSIQDMRGSPAVSPARPPELSSISPMASRFVLPDSLTD